MNQAFAPELATAERADLALRFGAVRSHSLELARPLSEEDQCVQSMPDASPTKWHLAHTSWFFEAVVLQAFAPSYTPFDSRYFFLFNSYYEALGPRHPRPQRGLLTRPALAEIHRYRQYVDAAMFKLMSDIAPADWAKMASLIELGLNHEQQHQELLLTDVLHLLSCNPLLSAYGEAKSPPMCSPGSMQWLSVQAGVKRIGHDGQGFAFDNETPAHEVLLQPYQIAHRLVSCAEYLAFMEDGGYARSELWLSDGWAAVQAQGWQAPAYWIAPGDTRAPSPQWQTFGLQGTQALVPDAPVTHLSFYEAAAYAEWASARLPTEFEWEVACALPQMQQMMGAVWQWTRSAYAPYPGFQPMTGSVREYNGKFMVGQQVLRGSSFATPPGHSRPSYRNFFPPAARWQFSGIRLAKDMS